MDDQAVRLSSAAPKANACKCDKLPSRIRILDKRNGIIASWELLYQDHQPHASRRPGGRRHAAPLQSLARKNLSAISPNDKICRWLRGTLNRVRRWGPNWS